MTATEESAGTRLSRDVLERAADLLSGEEIDRRRGVHLLNRLLDEERYRLDGYDGTDLSTGIAAALRRIESRESALSPRAERLLDQLDGVWDLPEPEDVLEGSVGEDLLLPEREGDVFPEGALPGDRPDDEHVLDRLKENVDFLLRFRPFERDLEEHPIDGVVGLVGEYGEGLEQFLYQVAYARLLAGQPVLFLTVSPDDGPVERMLDRFPRVERFRERGLLRVESLSPDLTEDEDEALDYVADLVERFVSAGGEGHQVFVHPLSMFYLLFDENSIARLIYRLRPLVPEEGTLYVTCRESDDIVFTSLCDTLYRLEEVSDDAVRCTAESPPEAGEAETRRYDRVDGLLLPEDRPRPGEGYVRCERCGTEVFRDRVEDVEGRRLCEDCADAVAEPEEERRRII